MHLHAVATDRPDTPDRPQTVPARARWLRAVPAPAQVLVAERLCRRLTPDLSFTDISMTVSRGESVAVLGPTEAGKTALLAMLAGMEEPDTGVVLVAGHAMSYQSDADQQRLRRRHIGMLYRNGTLLEHLTVAQNIVFARHLANQRGYRDLTTRLAAVGLAGRGDDFPARLTAGERARARLAVALANDPALLIADEPTGDLEEDDGREILDLLRTQTDRGTAVLLATRTRRLTWWCDRTIRLSEGHARPE